MGNGVVDGSIDLSFQFQVALRILSGLVAWGAKIAFPEKLGNKLIHIYFICFDLIECINEILCNRQTTTIATLCVAAIGYKNTMPQMGNKAISGVFWMAMFLSFGLPIIGWLCNIVAMKFYELDKDRMVQVQKNIAEMKEQ